MSYLLTIIGLLLFCDGTSSSDINIAWMAVEPFTYLFNASTSLGALKYVIDEIENNTSLLAGHTFKVKWKNSACSSKMAVGEMFQFLENNDTYPIDFFLGPICSGAMAPVAQLASYLNIPVFGWISSDPPLADKTLYSTLVRFLWSINNIGQGIAILCRDAGWKRVAIISTTGDDYGVLAEGIRDVLIHDKSDKVTVQRWVEDRKVGPSQSEIQDAYNLVKDEARIIILVVPETELRNWSKGAYDSHMTDGDYVFIYTNQQTPDERLFNLITSREFWEYGDSWDRDVKKAFDNFILVFAKTLDFNITNNYLEKFQIAANNWNSPPVAPAKPDFYSLFLYDAMKVYARFATEESTTSNGRVLFDAAKRSITRGGATGDIILSDTCDRIPDYRFFDVGRNEVFQVAAETISSLEGTQITRKINFLNEFIWGDGSEGLDNAPPDTPSCGFDGELCTTADISKYWAPPLVIILVITIILIVYFVHRKLKYEQDLTSLTWKINYDDMIVYMGGKAPGSQLNLRTKSQQLIKSRTSMTDSLAGQQLFVTVANYKGLIVAIKKVRKPQGIKLERELLQEMKTMTEVKSSYLNTFVGACIDVNKPICCVWEYCTKGSLQDVIFNESIKLDDMFKFSISIDILKGLEYLHESSLRVHGQLKSSNVVVDNRWTCKLTDYGLTRFREGEEPDPEQSEYARYTPNDQHNIMTFSLRAGFLWTPPEALREDSGENNDIEAINERCRCSTNSGDIYSVAVIIKETFCRNAPYQEYEDDFTPKEIIDKVVISPSGGVFRPDLAELTRTIQDKEVIPKLRSFIEQCWSEEVKDRPTATYAVKILSRINPFKKSNVVDNMVMMMEKYSNQLEEIVGERTLELQEEQKKTEDLLFKMLPKSVADDLKHGKSIDAESFDIVTIYFSDIPGFTELAAECTPLQVVDILNGVYSLMDETINNHDVYKVETVGDVYVLVSGLPLRNGDRHIVEVVNCALDLISTILTFKVPHKPSHKLPLRIGINTGAIVTGVVGLTNPRYCLFGDTMNTASRMESNGKQRGKYRQGKGMMNTYWLVGKEDYTAKLPDYRSELLNDQPPPEFLPPTNGKKVSNPKLSRPSAESGFVEMSLDSCRDTYVCDEGTTHRRQGTVQPPPLIEIDPPASNGITKGLPRVDVTSEH
ncbi:hypothetical protein LSH36_785g03085 [Paralvinella palmiformis]|uniref:guanylate cyclase n=1 Tax=Paralvinella palmiformis TaxID=53620 RepID=A0AAD9J1V9_9ANNE|nr:hypothetical protein LSH36_785g03085 [Paralvinella palmiformis]